jgi:hypothetical protein
MSERTSSLRQRMIDDMTIRNMSANTQKAYTAKRDNEAGAQWLMLHRENPAGLALDRVFRNSFSG